MRTWKNAGVRWRVREEKLQTSLGEIPQKSFQGAAGTEACRKQGRSVLCLSRRLFQSDKFESEKTQSYPKGRTGTTLRPDAAALRAKPHMDEIGRVLLTFTRNSEAVSRTAAPCEPPTGRSAATARASHLAILRVRLLFPSLPRPLTVQ